MLEKSRIIFNAGQKQQMVQLFNANNYSVLVQLWVNNGEVNSGPDDASNVPVIPLPAIFSLGPGESRSIRLLNIQGAYPSDKESLFWLNIYEVPPKPSEARISPQQMVSVTMQTQIKLFWRPALLEEKAKSSLTAPKVRWRDGQLEIENQSPFFITISRIKLGSQKATSQPDVIKPFAKASIKLPTRPASHSAVIHYIDDNGVEQHWLVDL